MQDAQVTKSLLTCLNYSISLASKRLVPVNLFRARSLSCADPGIFVRGGPGQSEKKSSDVFFVCLFVFFSPQLILQNQMVNFNEIYHFSRFQRGSNIFQGGGGSNFFQGGPIAYFL